MQRTPTEMDFDGHVVHAGAAVQVKWLGIWYEGTVVKFGHKRNLYKVRDVLSKETVLLDSKHLQPMEAFVMDKRISAGVHVVYKDGDQWREGVVDSKSAVGIVMVSWRKSGLSEENINWFELSHIAPVIHNELYNEHNRDRLEAGKSGLLFNDAIEPRPRTMDNMLYESESDHDEEILTELAKSKSPPPRSTTRHPQKTAQNYGFKEATRDRHNVTADSAPFPAPPVPLPTFPFLPAPMFISYPPMMHSYGNVFLPADHNHYNNMKMSPSFVSSPTPLQPTLPHPRSLKRPELSHTSVPCITSYTKSTNGIPPHPSSKYFRNLRSAKLGKQKTSRAHAKAELKKSESQAYSEPTDYATIAEVLEPLTEHLTKVPKHGNSQTPKQHLPKQVHAHHQTPSSHSSPNTTSTPSPPPPPPRPRKPPQRSATVAAQQPMSSSAHQPLSSATHESRHRWDNHLPAAEVRGAEDEVVSEEDEQRLTDQESIQAHKDKDQGGVLALMSASPAHVSVPHGGATLLTCAVRSSHNVRYKWTKDGKPISEHDPFFTLPAPGMLQIQMASLYLTGEYKCVASDDHSSLERVFHLTVTSDVQVSAQQSTNVAAESQLKVTPKESNRDMFPDVTAAEVHRVSSSQSHSQPPVIIIDEPPSKPPVTAHPLSPELLVPSGRDTLDVRDDKMERRDTDNVANKQEVNEGRRTAKRNRRRVSNALKNDMEQYLEGYGENYGEQSSKVLEPWMEDFSREVGEQRKRKGKGRRKKKTKRSTSEGSSSPTKGTPKKQESPKESKRNVKLPSALLGKKKKQQQVEEENVPLSKSWQRKVLPKTVKDSPAELDEEETNSVAVHTSIGASSGSEISLKRGEKEGREGDRLELPQEQESLNDSVRRLQLSVQEFCPEQLHFAEKEKKKGFLSSIFPKNKLF